MITNDFILMDSAGNLIDVDAFGDHLAFCCFDCQHPILACAAENQKGSDEQHPAVCKGCGNQFFLDVRYHAEKLYIHQLNQAGEESV